MEELGLVWSGLSSSGLVWSVLVWSGLVWSGDYLPGGEALVEVYQEAVCLDVYTVSARISPRGRPPVLTCTRAWPCRPPAPCAPSPPSSGWSSAAAGCPGSWSPSRQVQPWLPPLPTHLPYEGVLGRVRLPLAGRSTPSARKGVSDIDHTDLKSTVLMFWV